MGEDSSEIYAVLWTELFKIQKNFQKINLNIFIYISKIQTNISSKL
jgi:hypothetical protein